MTTTTDDPTAAAPAPDRPRPAPDWERDAAFRATLLEVLPPEAVPILRDFGGLLHDLALEYRLPATGTPAEALAAQLRAAAADLRFLRSYLLDLSRVEDEEAEDEQVEDKEIEEEKVEEEEDEEEGSEAAAGEGSLWSSPRQRRWRAFAARLAERLGELADELDAELAGQGDAGLAAERGDRG